MPYVVGGADLPMEGEGKANKVFNSENLMISIADTSAQKYNLAYLYVQNPCKMAEDANKTAHYDM